MRAYEANGGGSADEQFPAELLSPFTGTKSANYDNTFINFVQLKGKVKSVFNDDWSRSGVDQWNKTGPFKGLELAMPLVDTPPSTTQTIEAESIPPESGGSPSSNPESSREISWASIGDVTGLWAAAELLESVHLRGANASLGVIDAPELKSLVIETGGLPLAAFDALVAMKTPKLENLVVWFGDDGYGAEVTETDLPRLLARSDLPLRRLTLKNCAVLGSAFDAIAKSPIMTSLRELDLSKSTLGDEELAHFTAHAAAFKHLDVIDLSDNLFSEAGLESLKPSCRWE